MPTNPNMVAIQTVTVGSGGAASIEFTSIPQTYTDLVIRVSTRSTDSGDNAFGLRFNGSSTAAYSMRRLWGNGASAFSGLSTSVNNMEGILGVNPSGSTASTFGNAEIYIPNYTSSNNKSVSIDAVNENNATTAYAELYAGLWSNTSAITQVTLGYMTGNFVQYSTATLYGVTSAGYGAKATGGIITSDANYYYHTFVASGTFTPTSTLSCDYLIVAGGGGGANLFGGGGGGGMLTGTSSITANTAVTVTVGGGGATAATGTTAGNGANGSNSVFNSITATGGGWGGAAAAGNGGGSGGGGGAWAGVSYSGGAGTSGQGNNGSAGSTGDGSGGGGGGAGAAGGTATTSVGGAGGNGLSSSISGSSVTYAGGGGGGAYTGNTTSATGGAGGTGGGGAGGQSSGSAGSGTGVPGTVNTGGGGGGGTRAAQTNITGGAGGSGIVIVRYAK